MSLKSKLRVLLGDILARFPTSSHPNKDKIRDRQLIKHLVLLKDEAPQQFETDSIGGCVRILTRNIQNTKNIAAHLKYHQDEFGIESIHIADRAIDNVKMPTKELRPAHVGSVVIKFKPSILLKYVLLQASDYQTYFQNEVFEETRTKSEKIVIDFSSPNIAKPFHFGHLKSTILGNYLANLNSFLGNRVTKLNYIGDWGTQYGLLKLGLEETNDGQYVNNTSSISGNSPLRCLLDVYVKANERGSRDEAFYSEAKRRFLQLEEGQENANDLKQWREIRDLSLDELKLSYSQLGINFDVYEFESNYAREAKEMTKHQLEGKSFVNRLEDGVMVAHVDRNGRILEVPLLRSDGASLYITREICSAVSRWNRYGFDKMLYVVGADQEKHFYCLGQLLRGLNYDWYDRLVHVKMGKVLGMSSRSGEAVLLADIIKEATERYIESTKNTPTTKVTSQEEMVEVARYLALTALFVYDMRNARTANYEFDWDSVMMPSTRGGINLQTSFARLDSILRKASEQGLEPISADLEELHPDAISCIDGVNLLNYLLELDTALHKSYWSMDPAPLVNHGLKLSRAINRARRSPRLMVLNEEDVGKARTRLSLFKSSHKQLEFIIKLIGLKPLSRV